MQSVDEEPQRGFSMIYRSAATRATVVTTALGLVAFLFVLSIYHDIAGFGLVGLAEAGHLTTATAVDFDVTTAWLGYAHLALFLIAAIAFLAWLSRSVDNVPALGGGRPMVTPRWAIGWWFVPVASLFRPYQIVKDVNRRLALPTDSSGSRLILAWWLVWAFANVAAILPTGVKVDSAQSLSTWLDLTLFSHILELVAALLAIAVVRQVQRRVGARALTVGQSAASTLPAAAG